MRTVRSMGHFCSAALTPPSFFNAPLRALALSLCFPLPPDVNRANTIARESFSVLIRVSADYIPNFATCFPNATSLILIYNRRDKISNFRHSLSG